MQRIKEKKILSKKNLNNSLDTLKILFSCVLNPQFQNLNNFNLRACATRFFADGATTDQENTFSINLRACVTSFITDKELKEFQQFLE